MLRDALSELTHSGHVEVVKRVRSFPLINSLCKRFEQLMMALEVASFKEIGKLVNDTVLTSYSSTPFGIYIVFP